MRGESRKVLPGTRPQGPTTAPGTRLQPGRHDLLWVLGSSLAAERGWPSDYGRHSAANLPCVPSSCRTPCAGTRYRHLPTLVFRTFNIPSADISMDRRNERLDAQPSGPKNSLRFPMSRYTGDAL